MKVGFIGLGNVGGKLAGSLLRNGFDLTVRDLDRDVAAPLLDKGAAWADSPAAVAEIADVVITCLPSPAVCARVMESTGGVLEGLADKKIWMEMSTTDEAEVKRLAALAGAKGGASMDCPVSGGCHRAATGNISIFAGGERRILERVFPLLQAMGRRILHTGPLGSASRLKAITNYLASANLVTLCEALVTSKKAGIDLDTAYDAIRISSGNSFVHETESQAILTGSRNINFTMDLVVKDLSLFLALAQRAGAPLEVAPLLLQIFQDAVTRYGGREWSPNIVRRLEEACGVAIAAPGFPAEVLDDQPEAPGVEVGVRERRGGL